jgi:hypothetical protein
MPDSAYARVMVAKDNNETPAENNDEKNVNLELISRYGGSHYCFFEVTFITRAFSRRTGTYRDKDGHSLPSGMYICLGMNGDRSLRVAHSIGTSSSHLILVF